MTKEEQKWLGGATVIAAAVFIFLLYLISDSSPLAKTDAGETDFLLNQETNVEATSEVKLNLDGLTE